MDPFVPPDDATINESDGTAVGNTVNVSEEERAKRWIRENHGKLRMIGEDQTIRNIPVYNSRIHKLRQCLLVLADSGTNAPQTHAICGCCGGFVAVDDRDALATRFKDLL
jgi:hypothetical protein